MKKLENSFICFVKLYLFILRMLVSNNLKSLKSGARDLIKYTFSNSVTIKQFSDLLRDEFSKVSLQKYLNFI